MSGAERETLDRFARHLQISETKARRYHRACRRRTASFPTDEQEQLDVLKMLARVAYSDGCLQREEAQLFANLGDEFGISRVRLARVLEEAEGSAHRRRHLRALFWCAGALAVALLTSLIWLQWSGRPDEMTGFKAVDGRIRASLVLVHTRYVMRHPEKSDRRASSTGTGFFVSADGLVLTNKHVVQPWRFPGGLKSIAEGYELDPESVEILAWREGDEVQNEGGSLARTAFTTADGTLEVAALAPDADRPMRERPAHLQVAGLFCHASDDGDLAVLRCRGAAAMRSVDLAESSRSLRRLDPVMVVGYPRGLHLLETRHAVSMPSVGRVRKCEDTIFITAPVVGGNSGGPLVDALGQVVGIATRTSGDATLANCIRVEHAHALLRRAR